ncbi:MAG: aminotransferase class V-fold PLP-dependent enzyme [Candidatus Bathyarchaeota archaeon]|nr:aminotransferase class V-fold PLP-dependent enzyme [Candidatus Bathyarchaeota archaeon]
MIQDPYKKLGLRRVINAATCLTRLGGSIAHPSVYRAMEEASKSFVQIPELQHWAGKAIAEATGAEAGHPTAGASNAITLAAAACIMKGTELENYNPLELETWGSIAKRLPAHTEGLRTEFIVQRTNRNVYDHAVEFAGGTIVEADPTEEALNKAYNKDKTAAYYFTVRSGADALPLETVVKVAHSHDAPVIVDAAAELPPRKNLKRYIQASVDLVIFSAGKYISAPNNSGILAGRADLIKLAHLQAYPFHGVGRASKMSRETIVGFVTALRLYLQEDEEKTYNKWLKKAQWITDQLKDTPGVEAGLDHQATIEDDEPMVPVSYIKLGPKTTGITGAQLSKRLRDGDPSIEALYEPGFMLKDAKDKLMINPQYLDDEDVHTVVDTIKAILKAAKK